MLKTSNSTRREFLAACSAGLLASRAFAAPGEFQAPGLREFRRAGMVYRRLGQTDMDVSLLSFGSHTDPADRLPAGQDKTVLTPAGQARQKPGWRAIPPSRPPEIRGVLNCLFST